MMRATECLDEGLSIEDKIKMARHMYDSCSEQLKREPHIHQLIEKLEECLENSREAMLELGIVERNLELLRPANTVMKRKGEVAAARVWKTSSIPFFY
jgi:hypothetical protein